VTVSQALTRTEVTRRKDAPAKAYAARSADDFVVEEGRLAITEQMQPVERVLERPEIVP